MYKQKTHIHFVGIGGIGMSGIATILKYQGYTVSGCDNDLCQQSIVNLKAINCIIQQGNNGSLCHDPSITIVVYSSAIRPDNPEIVAAQQRGIATIPRAMMLAELMRTKYSVAITGAHGKTTTTSLISHILIEAGIDPTIIIGGHLATISNNARMGEGAFLVAEADESDRSLLHLRPTFAVVTNIDLEHLETYKDLDDIKRTFQSFLSEIPFYGKAFLCVDNENIRSILPIPHINIVRYGIDSTDTDICAKNLTLHANGSRFDVHTKDTEGSLGTVTMPMPGKHNALNALASIAFALDLAIPFTTIVKALGSFGGVDRRFSFRGSFQGASLFDDYGHHPKEIEVTLEVARQKTTGKVFVVFQPHRYTRTYHLWNDFVRTFLASTIDHLLITDIYPASELPIESVSSDRLVNALKEKNPLFDVHYMQYEPSFANISTYLAAHAQPDDLILFLGAGVVHKLAEKIAQTAP